MRGNLRNKKMTQGGITQGSGKGEPMNHLNSIRNSNIMTGEKKVVSPVKRQPTPKVGNIGPIIPIPKGRKGPLLKNWQSLTAGELLEAINQDMGCNLGIRLDKYASLDPDSAAARELVAKWKEDGTLTPTTAWRTASGAERYLYLRPDDLDGPITIPGLDFQLRTGSGLQDVIPPSHVIEESKLIDGKYRWLSGMDPVSQPPTLLPHAIHVFFQENINGRGGGYGGGRGKELASQLASKSVLNFTQGHRDSSLFTLANVLVKAGYTEEDILQVLIPIGEKCIPPFPANEILTKILSAERRSNNRETSIAQEVREWVLASDGVFQASDSVKELQLASPGVIKNVTKILLRMKDEGLVEKYGNKRGYYRVINKEAEVLNWFDADTDLPFDVKLPFDLHREVDIYPKNLIIVAGATNAGKTALLLNAARLNLPHAKVSYFSSEMTQEELKIRLTKFQDQDLCSLDDWRNVVFRQRMTDFADVIDPDGINIIDYIEVTKDFYQVAEPINAIYEKLNKGIAIIAIQKKDKSDYGIGGHFNAFRSRLYLAMDSGTLKIVKAKNWSKTASSNPNGKIYNFKLVQGAKFIIKNVVDSKS